ncbi:hypothetical protein [Methanoplanus endosymbiosus]|uniref:Uncharacterized protein n=1 Tax=Methanoplanus endosymbiosus TaxID=33865 RepID=A0A9E7PL78_9EURY|nr:hypothetical protein [Methanoplanus endosymbiosus]UUX92163.1 hypothetical protein L6E24_12505 [Methanoplanus endosymbiosus]
MPKNRKPEMTEKCRRRTAISLLLLAGVILLLLSAGCTGRENAEEYVEKIEISSENTCWSPIMSSIVGIDITPHYSGDAGDIQYHWHASEGAFLLWNKPDYRVINLGNNTITGEETLWWSYTERDSNTGNTDNSGDEKITISIEAVSADSGVTPVKGEYLIERENLTFCLKNP